MPPQPPPLAGTKAPDTGVIATGGYATGSNPAFDSDHFAIWGQACAEDVGLIQNFVQQSQPDVMLVMLGFNDLGKSYDWGSSTAVAPVQHCT